MRCLPQCACGLDDQVEIREKKRLAERLEGKAKQAAEAAAASLASAAQEKVQMMDKDAPIPSPVS